MSNTHRKCVYKVNPELTKLAKAFFKRTAMFGNGDKQGGPCCYLVIPT